MGSGATAEWALPYPTSTDPNNVPSDIQGLATQLDGLILGGASGTLAARPAAGKARRIYFATDNGLLYYDTGSAWVAYSAASAVATTTGDLLYASGPNALARLAVGTPNQALMGGTTPGWQGSPVFSGPVSTQGLTGATAASRYVGATASGPPTSGSFTVGDFVIDQTGVVWIFTSSGWKLGANYLAGHLGANVTGITSTAAIMSTSSLRVGTWRLQFGATWLAAAGAGVAIEMVAGTATCSFEGQRSTDSSNASGAAAPVAQSIEAQVTVTAAGTVTLNGFATASSSVFASGPSSGFPNATGWSAEQIS